MHAFARAAAEFGGSVSLATVQSVGGVIYLSVSFLGMSNMVSGGRGGEVVGGLCGGQGRGGEAEGEAGAGKSRKQARGQGGGGYEGQGRLRLNRDICLWHGLTLSLFIAEGEALQQLLHATLM